MTEKENLLNAIMALEKSLNTLEDEDRKDVKEALLKALSPKKDEEKEVKKDVDSNKIRKDVISAHLEERIKAAGTLGVDLDPDAAMLDYVAKNLFSPIMDRIDKIETKLEDSINLIAGDEIKSIHDRMDDMEKRHITVIEQKDRSEVTKKVIEEGFNAVLDKINLLEERHNNFAKKLGVAKSVADKVKYDYRGHEDSKGVGADFFPAKKKEDKK